MDATAEKSDVLGNPIVVECEDRPLDELLSKEWLLTNRIGAYASTTVVGCNTRRYHGLLVGATAPPVGRIVALSTVMEQLKVGKETFELATNEFPGAFSPQGVQYLKEFRNDVAATFIYRIGELELSKRIILLDRRNAVAIQYTLRGSGKERAMLQVSPFAAMRDFHSLRRINEMTPLIFEKTKNGVIVQDRDHRGSVLYLNSKDASFEGDSQ
ncbi:MAG: glycogen debranching enzyme N-terminal domain-containing protein, partial [Planctomycetota bacterium]